jgi:tetratricopeptide (TPR) repeat protein
MAYNMLGNALSSFAETEAAKKAFETAISLDPKLAQAHVNLALILAQTNDLDGAAKELHTAIRLQGNTSDAAISHYLCAKVYAEQDQRELAVAELDAAIKLQPQYREAWFLLGTVQRASLENALALRAFERAASLDPANPQYQYELGSEYLRQGKAHLAALHLRRALAGMPDDRSVLYKLQRALREDNRPEEASQVEAHMHAVVAKADDAGTHAIEAQQLDDQGTDLEKQGNIVQALEKYRAALELAPDENGYRLNYALALCRMHHLKEGIAEMREILRHDEGNAEARRALYIAEDQLRSTSETTKGPAH